MKFLAECLGIIIFVVLVIVLSGSCKTGKMCIHLSSDGQSHEYCAY